MKVVKTTEIYSFMQMLVLLELQLTKDVGFHVEFRLLHQKILEDLRENAYFIGKNQKNKYMEQNVAPRFMVESTGVYLESYYHVLKTLQSTNYSMLPFEKYLTMASVDDENQVGTAENAIVVDVPDYARAPGFHFNLNV